MCGTRKSPPADGTGRRARPATRDPDAPEEAVREPISAANDPRQGEGDDPPAVPASTRTARRQHILQKIMSDILEDADKQFDRMEESIRNWRRRPTATDPSGRLLRVLHKLKGGFSFVGLKEPSRLIHNLETLLTDLRANPKQLNDAFFSRLQDELHQVRRLLSVQTGALRGSESAGEASAVREAPQHSAAFSSSPARPAPGEALDYMLMRLRQCVRQVSLDLSRDVRFEVFARPFPVERALLDRFIGPLEQLLRNALDHGVEPPIERIRQGKEPRALLSVEIAGRDGQLVMEVADDGRGLNYPAIRDRAYRFGMTRRRDDLADEEVAKFILSPGFSTAPELTLISGRGVGLDVVATEVRKLGGTISIHSIPGEGCRFTLQVPMHRPRRRRRRRKARRPSSG